MGQNVGALRSQTLPAANLGCDESRFGGSEPARRSLLRLDASRTTADDIRLAGRLADAVSKARAHQPDLAIEVEAETLDQVDEALEAGADIILVDNMQTADIRESVRRARDRAKIEISGGVTPMAVPLLRARGGTRPVEVIDPNRLSLARRQQPITKRQDRVVTGRRRRQPARVRCPDDETPLRARVST